jgi:hypothetical protein
MKSNNPIPLFGLGNYSRSRPVNDQSRTNLYAEVETDQQRGSRLTLYPTPGLLASGNYGLSPVRMIFSKGDFKYIVNKDTLCKESNDGTFVVIGTLLTSDGLIDVSDNGTQLMLVDGSNGYIFNYASGIFTQIISAGFPVNPTSVTYLNLRFVVTISNSGEYYWSNINDGLAWNALNFSTEEANPDDLTRVIADNGQLILFGEFTTGFAGATNSDDEAGAFGRIGASALEFGLAARWSLDKYSGALIGLFKNRLGGIQVATLTGYSYRAVSTPDIEVIFSKYEGIENATGFSYMYQGHAFYQISFPSENVSWLYDGQNGGWSKTESNGGMHRGRLQVNHLNKCFVTDFRNGLVYELTSDSLTDNGSTIAREFIGRHLMTGNNTRIQQLWIDMEMGVGTDTGQGAAPQVMMSISKDGGQTWGAANLASIGKSGQYRGRAVYRRLGRSSERGEWLFKFRVTDPVKVVFIGAWGVVT